MVNSDAPKSPSATTKTLEDLIGERCTTKDLADFPDLKDDERCLTCQIWEAIDNYTTQRVIEELEKLLKKQYFAEGYGYDHGQVVDVFDIEDAIKSLKGGIDG